MNTYQILSLCGVPALIGIAIAFLIQKPLEKRVKTAEDNQATQESQQKAIMLGVQALLRDRLLQAFSFYLARGWIGTGERDNVDNMYVQYEALGPNNVISDIYNQVRALPSIPPEARPMEAHAVAQ
jgi:hypothetical protein